MNHDKFIDKAVRHLGSKMLKKVKISINLKGHTINQFYTRLKVERVSTALKYFKLRRKLKMWTLLSVFKLVSSFRFPM